MKIQIAALAIALSACTAKQSQDETGSTVNTDSAAAAGEILAAQQFEENNIPVAFTFDYHGVTRNATSEAMATMDPLTDVLTLATRSIRTQDSVEYLFQGEDLTAKDSAMFKPAVDRAYKAILSYKDLLESGSLTVSTYPDLLQLTRVAGPADSFLRVCYPRQLQTTFSPTENSFSSAVYHS